MNQLNKWSDTRLDDICVYCRCSPQTRDHVPSRILLDEPFPENLPVVPCCDNCNQSFSKDEEYFACLIECVLRGTTNPENLVRKKIRRILTDKPLLRDMLERAMTNCEDEVTFQIDEKRISNVVLKLARGHASFENSELQLAQPQYIGFTPVNLMANEERVDFFDLSSSQSGLWPEIGSRGLRRIAEKERFDGWVTVQENRYSYAVFHSRKGLKVRIIIEDYLACEVNWE